jgi:hypothetical protein
MYLDYDGHGSKFGDTSVHSQSGNQGEVSVYAAQRSSDHALTIIVINKSTKTVVCPLSVAGLASKARAQVYRYDQAKPSKIVHAAPQTFAGGHARITLPGYSITEYVIGAAGLAPGAVFLPRATSRAVLGAVGGPAAHPEPADAFRWAVGYKGQEDRRRLASSGRVISGTGPWLSWVRVGRPGRDRPDHGGHLAAVIATAGGLQAGWTVSLGATRAGS